MKRPEKEGRSSTIVVLSRMTGEAGRGGEGMKKEGRSEQEPDDIDKQKRPDMEWGEGAQVENFFSLRSEERMRRPGLCFQKKRRRGSKRGRTKHRERAGK